MELPDTLLLMLRLREEGGQWSGPYRFPLHLDPEKTAEVRTISVDRWVELDGQRLKVGRLELTPTRTALYLEGDEDNSAWLKDLSFYFTGADGTVYEDTDSQIGGLGQADGGVYTYYFQSLYFVKGDLTLWIDGAAWLEKDAGGIKVDLSTGQYTGVLPDRVEGLSVEESTGDGERQQGIVVTSTARQAPFAMEYRDGAGATRPFSGFSMRSASPEKPDIPAAAHFWYPVEDNVGETVELFPAYTWVTDLEEPLPMSLS